MKEPRKRGRPEGSKNKRKVYQPNDQMRDMVAVMLAGGIQQQTIYVGLGLTKSVFERAFKTEIAHGCDHANSKVVGKAFEKCMEGNVPMLQFWLSRRAGWKETTVSEVTGNQTVDMTTTSMTDKMQRFAKLITTFKTAKDAQKSENKIRKIAEMKDQAETG